MFIKGEKNVKGDKEMKEEVKEMESGLENF